MPGFFFCRKKETKTKKLVQTVLVIYTRVVVSCRGVHQTCSPKWLFPPIQVGWSAPEAPNSCTPPKGGYCTAAVDQKEAAAAAAAAAVHQTPAAAGPPKAGWIPPANCCCGIPPANCCC
jgi:hypothetical protein